MKSSITETIHTHSLDFAKKDKAKKLQNKISNKLSLLFPEKTYGSRMQECSRYYHSNNFKILETCELRERIKGEKLSKVNPTRTCKLMTCPTCSKIKSGKLAFAINTARTELMELVPNTRNHKYYMLTLTVRNPQISQLKPMVTLMQKAINDMLLKSEHNKIYSPLRKNLLGSLKSLEFFGSNTKQGEAHPHFHILLAFDGTFKTKDLNKSLLLNMWQHAMKDKSLSIDAIDFRQIRSRSKTLDDGTKVILNAFTAGLYETIKYALKPTDFLKLSNSDSISFITQIQKTRQYSTSGIFTQYNQYFNENIKPREKLYDELNLFLLSIDVIFFNQNIQQYTHVDTITLLNDKSSINKHPKT